MNPQNESVIQDLVWSIRRLVRAVYLDSQKISKRYGLTGPQSAVVRNLYNNGPMSSADLSRNLFVTPSNITGIIDRLEKKQLVERIKKEGDRRVALITLTHAGNELSKTLPDPIMKKFIAELADLEPEHVQVLAVAMNQILNLIDTEDVDEDQLEINPESVPIDQEDTYQYKNHKL
jgi:DNA-binding MarR family transcriptional regulator